MVLYTYHGESLYSYCKRNNIIISTIYVRIRKIKNENPNLSDEEIIELAVQGVKSKLKYVYKGITLRNYCKENNINYDTIYKKIKKIRKANPSLSDDKIIELAINDKRNRKKYVYKGITLRDYCKENNISYGTIYKRIEKIREANPYLDADEITKRAIEYTPNRGNTKYLYKDESLIKRCDNINITPQGMYSRICRIKKENNDISVEEIVEKAINYNRKRGWSKYQYRGVPLTKYCDENNINYLTICKRISRIKDKCTILTDEELLLIAMHDTSLNDILLSKMVKHFKIKKYIDSDVKKYIDSITNPISYNQNKIDMMIKRKTK